MAKETRSQKKTVERVMHEFKHGELDSGPGGKAGRVKSPKQAIAIALSEAGVSTQKSPRKNAESREATQAREAKGKSAPEHNKAELYEQARKRDIPGRSKMSKAQLEQALRA